MRNLLGQHQDDLEHFRVSPKRGNVLGLCFIAFSSREPVSTSRENAHVTDVLVAAAGDVRSAGCGPSAAVGASSRDMRERVRRLQRRDDALELGEQLEGVERLASVAERYCTRPLSRAARNAPGRCRDSRARPRSNVPRGSGRRRPAAGRCGCRGARRGGRHSAKPRACSPVTEAVAGRLDAVDRDVGHRRGRGGTGRSRSSRRRCRRPGRRAGGLPSPASAPASPCRSRLEVAHQFRIGVRAGGGADE
jgi:hypothetical protein